MKSSMAPNNGLMTALEEVTAQYRANHRASEQRYVEACRHMPGGNTRTVLHYSPFPLTWASGRANRLTDVDGLEYLDLLGDFSAGLCGHSNEIVHTAIKEALDKGLALGGPNQYEARLAAAIRSRFPSIDLVRFTNSGTEANLMALSAVRALNPNRSRIMVFEGSYHGSVFSFDQSGRSLNPPFGWLIGQYNDIEGTRTLLRSNAKSLAAVLVEPMLGAGGCIPGTLQFLRMLRDECTALEIVLIFDEVMTSRLSPSGLQGRLGITPDMTTLGKYLGGAASFGAFGGRKDIMERFDPSRPDPIEHPGTFNNNVLSMAGGLATLTAVFTREEAARINTLGDQLRERLNAVGLAHDTSFQATGVGSVIGLHFKRGEINTYRDTEPTSTTAKALQSTLDSILHLDMLNRGYYLARRGYIALSLPTTVADCDQFVSALDGFFNRYSRLIP
jgi:glutamate-1-semialdehyde 2,1-aminomutase